MHITINSPREAKSKATEQSVRNALRQGYKTFEILLAMNFVAPDSVVRECLRDFTLLKNKLALQRDNEIHQPLKTK